MKFTLNKQDGGEVSISRKKNQFLEKFSISAQPCNLYFIVFQHGGPVVVSMAIPQATLSLSASSGLYAKVSFILL